MLVCNVYYIWNVYYMCTEMCTEMCTTSDLDDGQNLITWLWRAALYYSDFSDLSGLAKPTERTIFGYWSGFFGLASFSTSCQNSSIFSLE